MAILVAGLSSSSFNEISKHPDFRQICAFFLGWVFFCGIQHAGRAVVRVSKRHFHSKSTFRIWVTREDPDPEKTSLALNYTRQRDSTQREVFAAILSLFLAFASLFHFLSLLSFSPSGYGCPFVIAAAGTAGGLARLVGLVPLFVELRCHGTNTAALVISALCIIAALASTFASSAIGIGTLVTIPELNTHICYQNHFLPTSSAASVLFAATELFVFISLVKLLAVDFSRHRHRVDVFFDIRLGQSFALILFEALSLCLNVVPHADLVMQLIPFSLGSLLVIFAFNWKPKIAGSTPAHTVPSPLVTVTPPSIQIVEVSQPSPKYQTSLDFHSHPYAAPGKEDILRTARSSRTVDSDYARSVHAAIFQIALRRPRLSKIPDLPRLPASPADSLAAPDAPTLSPVESSRTEAYVRALSALLGHGSASSYSPPNGPEHYVTEGNRRGSLNDSSKNWARTSQSNSVTVTSPSFMSQPSSLNYTVAEANPMWEARRSPLTSSSGGFVQFPARPRFGADHLTYKRPNGMEIERSGMGVQASNSYPAVNVNLRAAQGVSMQVRGPRPPPLRSTYGLNGYDYIINH